MFSLETFCEQLPHRIAKLTPEEKKDSLLDFMKDLSMTKADYSRFVFHDESKNYTRNLISTDHDSYVLLLLCWSPGKESPIHDHPCDGCWMKALEGGVRETRYVKDEATGTMEVTHDETYVQPQIAYINDSMGYHKVANASETEPAITLHLYSPCFEQCKFWPDKNDSEKAMTGTVCFHSEYGNLVER